MATRLPTVTLSVHAGETFRQNPHEKAEFPCRLLHLLRRFEVAVTVCVLAVPGGLWGFHEAARGRGGFLCYCGGDVKHAAQVVDRFLRDRSHR